MNGEIAAIQQTPMDDWKSVIGELEHQIAEWASSEHWNVYRTADEFGETGDRLNIETPEGDVLLLNSRRRDAIDGSHVMELQAFPSLYRVRLARSPENGGWIVRTDSGIPVRKPWNRSTFIEIASDLLAVNNGFIVNILRIEQALNSSLPTGNNLKL